MSLTLPVRSVAQVEEIAAIRDDDLRNRWITQTYSDLAQGMTASLGRTDASWCAFATWASLTAGAVMRGDLVRRLDDELGQEPGAVVLGDLNQRLRPLRQLGLVDRASPDHVEEVIDDVTGRARKAVAAGNAAVFAELGPVFAGLVEATAIDGSLDPRAVDGIGAAHLRRSGADRPDGVVRSLALLLEASREADPGRRSQLILLANFEAVLHEQARLQPFVERAIHGPVNSALEAIVSRSRFVPWWLVRMIAGRRLEALRELVEDAWDRVVTEMLMTLRIDGSELRLGVDVPPPAGAGLFPPALAAPTLPGLLAFLTEHDPTGGSGVGSGAVGWTDLTERMGYIVTLFRSRQQRPGLFDPPFTDDERDELLRTPLPLPPS